MEKRANPPVIAVSGFKNSGKTTLIEKMLPILSGRGLRVAVIKHDGHSFSADVPGADTFRHLTAGACGTAIFDGEKYMLTKRESVAERDLIPYFSDMDLILLEGFKSSGWPKLELVADGAESVCKAETLIGLVHGGGRSLPGVPPDVPVIAPGDYRAAADIILRHLGLCK
ncbi:MAG: molybdopterin-guanine dinucleotide biosynthesis protein B [Clostridiales Family XIII bacterium]|nr:molybdopterin-guanine dinucleotide biosynthesis protein B [Clostridiales Family XIII bacterium]